MKKIINYIFLLLAFVNCAASQQTNTTSLRPNPYTVDVAPLPIIDEDAYNVVLPPIPDAALQFRNGSGELIAPLRLGQMAPYTGVLFNNPAVARIEVEYRGLQEQCRIDRQADIDRMSSRAITDIHLLQTSMNAQAQSLNLMLTSRDQEIARLYHDLETAQHPRPDYISYILIGAGFLVVGAGTGLVIGFLAR